MNDLSGINNLLKHKIVTNSSEYKSIELSKLLQLTLILIFCYLFFAS